MVSSPWELQLLDPILCVGLVSQLHSVVTIRPAHDCAACTFARDDGGADLHVVLGSQADKSLWV